MKFKPLPIEAEIMAMPTEQAKMDHRSALVESLIRHPAFQLIVCLLRDTERLALEQLRKNPDAQVQFLLGRVQTVDYLRQAINGLVPGQPIDWAEEELEEFMPLDIADF